MRDVGLDLRLVADVGGLRAQWDALAAATGSPFLRSWWLDAVSRASDARPAYVLLLRGEVLLGGVALAVDRHLLVPRYRFLGQGVLTPDHLDLLAAPGEEAAVARAFAQWFRGRGSRLLDLDGLAAGALLARAIGRQGEAVDAAPYLTLGAGSDAYPATLSASFRRNLRRSARRLSEAGAQHRRIPPEEVPSALAAFWALHEARGDRDRLIGYAAVLDRIVLAGVDCGECHLDVIEAGGEPLAVSIAFGVGDRLSLYQVARSLDPAHGSAGTVLLDRVIDTAAGEYAEVDLLRGEEGYKDHFATGRRPLLRLRAAHGLPARAVLTVEAGLRRAVRRIRAARAGRAMLASRASRARRDASPSVRA
ncbi:GNAT family N-acetyltransferase [Nocardioides sp. BP30]|uniref:GNAT family N-acetyltransferase n=1 Tax=Nocardioides sp. BP30 TaxID=3036374 RepID=UPI00246853E8|nr:GNAT family N-acetyltransferase [Nocardioides sp. BP30]WGL51010.1 GNAT family N-acetyltransferase [Nocardioides sp. BP30]